MHIEVAKRLFTVDDYYRMVDAGILGPEDHVELIDGEIVTLSPIGTRHAGCVNRINRVFNDAFRERAVVSIQNPVRLSNYTEPEPDVVLLKYRHDDYRDKRMMAEDGSGVASLRAAETLFLRLRFPMSASLSTSSWVNRSFSESGALLCLLAAECIPDNGNASFLHEA